MDLDLVWLHLKDLILLLSGAFIGFVASMVIKVEKVIDEDIECK